MVVDVLFRQDTLLIFLGSQIFGFYNIKELYENDNHFASTFV